ncbi:YALI0B02376p [Yarrowia lipolytica CLIB122]|uniref:1-phosphatidylinositol 4-kinase n=2 Tax=Yarrowia lipolytica TaxID=4952 RepID=Q6CFY9_YARLI|nr:YALI0B02376p [Yarrowia lipolytica CLIB122]AOW01122.1 hypothetical protein YALI1_B03719g [Yarrowia lipolytica]KAB8285235.1 kinase-like domain-containing protein [Yarrowia lipolytica]KAE8174859.1 kinase-like domain-containing protein [Yarrowia lipolytica]KAJ8052016.1 kinase-like domain-containing protein [Yarrowia lipolytica]RMJ00729.1 kinase-like domain-containing protein [Yarrowia lipolytica]|eukprot:XP_500423.1 YALI0B02376p [Yarrowia lipolytica CLIB122]
MQYQRNSSLRRFVESDQFTLFRCLSYLERYAGDIGIHFYLCQKLLSFPRDEIEFILPQLVQLLITVETESMALEDIILDLSNVSAHCALLTFWQLQAHLTDLGDDPESFGFQVSRRVYNKLQYILFNIGEPPNSRIRENPMPAMVLASAIMGAIGMPQMAAAVGPIALSQGRKQRSYVFQIAPKLTRSRSTVEADRDALLQRKWRTISQSGVALPSKREKHQHEHFRDAPKATPYKNSSFSAPDLQNAYHSAPDLRPSNEWDGTRTPVSLEFDDAPGFESEEPRDTSPDDIEERAKDDQRKILRSNYFRCETQFMSALQQISARLLQVPKQARHAALKAELTLLNQELPAEVDIPLLVPSDTMRKNPTHHRIVRVPPAESAVLNSAERVPFLILIEYLEDDMTFDPECAKNKEVLEHADKKKYIFDLTVNHKKSSHARTPSLGRYHDEDAASIKSNRSATSIANSLVGSTIAELEELGIAEDDELPAEDADIGDISVISMDEETQAERVKQSVLNTLSHLQESMPSPKLHDVANSPYQSSPRTSDLSFASSYKFEKAPEDPVNHLELPDVASVATQMRTAAIMLTQLDSSTGSKLSKDEIASIKARIIDNMQVMEETTLDDRDLSLSKGAAGERKLENDLKTGGMMKSSDPSHAKLGEDWESKKARIRSKSPYGHLPNWQLASVIAKTGNDLRQEAFACQLIQAMKRIWDDAETGVWVKEMKILITSDTSGLIETINNGLSIHSIKKALETSNVVQTTAATQTTTKYVPTLTEYWKQTFGDEDSDRYQNSLNAFVRSLAAYSIICYILQIKDRHNGNILLDTDGHIMHIDFGFMLSNSPGGVGLEAAPFKLTYEYVELMGGMTSPHFELYRQLMKDAFKNLRKQAESIILLVDMMLQDSALPCFQLGPATTQYLRQRFQLQLSDSDLDHFVDTSLIQKSVGNIYTRIYDHFQLYTQGIYS